MTPDLSSIFLGHRAHLCDGSELVLERTSCGRVSVESGRLAVTTVRQDLRELVSAKVPSGTYSVEAEVAEDRLIAIQIRVTEAAPDRWEPRWTLADEPLLLADRSLLLAVEEQDRLDECVQWSDQDEALAKEFRAYEGRVVAARSPFTTVPIVYLGFQGTDLAAIAVTCGELKGEDWEFEDPADSDYQSLRPRSQLLTGLARGVNEARAGSFEALLQLAADDVLVVQGDRHFSGPEGLKRLVDLLPAGTIELCAPPFPEEDTVVLSLAVMPRVTRILGQIEVTAERGEISKVVLPEAFDLARPPPRPDSSTEADEALVARLSKLELSRLQSVFLEDIRRITASGRALTEGQRQKAQDLLARQESRENV